MTARDRIVIVALLAVAAIVGAWMLVVQPKRSEASRLASKISSAEAQLAAARSTLAQNEAARAAFARDYREVVRLGEAVPADDNVPSLMYELQSAASAAHVDFHAVVLQAASAGAASTPAPAPSSPSLPTAKPPAAKPSAPATPASTLPASTGLPPGATVGPAGFPTENFTLTFQGDFFHLADLLRRLEGFVTVNNSHVSVSGRLLTLNAINLGAAPTGFPSMDVTISATAYLVPASQGLLNGATPTGPGVASTNAVSGQGSASPAPAAITAPTVR